MTLQPRAELALADAAAPDPLVAMAAAAPIIAITYSSREFATWDPACPWPMALKSVVAAGGVPLAIDCATPQPRIHELVGLAAGLIVLGGGDIAPATYGGDESDPTISGVNTDRDVNELAVLEAADERRIPILAICRGFQLLNVARGGTLIADIPRDRASDVEHRPGMAALMRSQHKAIVGSGTRLARWLSRSGTIAVNSQHHQGVASVGENLVVVARSRDGLVEAVEATDRPVVGVQWHPEFLWQAEPSALALLRGFIDECREPERAA